MIPLQVRVKSWMRYRDEQVADFTGASLISICGENGAGKSSIFDAITYALYGKHRLGQQATEELITQDSDGSWVEFDFEVEGQRWRIHRGKSRGGVTRTGRAQAGATTQALYRWDEASTNWLLVPGTNLANGLQAAIDGVIRMSEPAFTSSFLLQQGAATQFLDSRPGKRFETISSLIGLEIYERLARAARDAAMRERDRVQDISRTLAPLAGISTTALSELQRQNDEAQLGLQGAVEQLAASQRRAVDAERAAERSAEIASLQAQIDEADALVAHK